ncbi:NTP transferase domain-containing protein [Geodermatophilus nigrescens]|uniref:Choline kinase n=1 Tax=Geodermatophilus nigrescens TaxID=1070870 RepID=A0A1M5EZH9_9ACTN|nr:phosphocholine cytidylyltransferase family protein [Geodermatophilus nigrescens]SHF84578.1 Choline kinase [Geodermatophilus nigrescens]
MRFADLAHTTAQVTGLAPLGSRPAAAPEPRPLQVVVLAAGMGTRLGRPLPKPLTPLVDGRSILRRQLDTVEDVFGGAAQVTAVVGFQAELVMQAAPDLRFAYNPHYARTNTSKSLLRGLRAAGPGGVLWLNGDVVFDAAVLESVLPELQADQSFVCVDTSVVGDEEVKYTLDAEGWIDGLSKTVRGGLGEAVGINFVSSADKDVLVEHLEACGDQDYFERGMETAIAEAGLRFRPLDISRWAAVEVDFEADLDRANALFSTSRPRLHPVPDGTRP